MRLDALGNLGISTTSPVGKIHTFSTSTNGATDYAGNNFGIVVFINHEQETNSLLSRFKKIKSTILKGKPPTTYKKMDTKDFGIGAQILHKLGAHKLNLMTNSKNLKRVGLTGYGIEIVTTTKY